MKKKLFALLATVTMLLVAGVFTVSVDAAAFSGNATDSIKWACSDTTGTFIMQGTGTLDGWRVPDNLRDIITKVSLSGSIEGVGEGSFEGCPNLTNVTFGSKVKVIKKDAFRNCPKLTRLSFPKTPVMERVEDGAFRESGLTVVALPSTVTYVGDYAFADCLSLGSIIFPPSLDYFGDYILSGCSSLTSALLPDISTPSIGAYTFKDCIELESITIPNIKNEYVIEEGAFSGCKNIKELTFAQSVADIEPSAFAGCEKLESVTVVNSAITELKTGVFKDLPSLTSVTMPSITLIKSGAFDNCPSLVDIPWVWNKLSLESYAFKNCLSLESVGFCNLYSIGSHAFYNCPAFDIITIDTEGKTKIESSAFEGNSALRYFITDGTVTDIGDCAFMGCKRLDSINMSGDVVSIGDYAFKGCSAFVGIISGDTEAGKGDLYMNSVGRIGTNAFKDCVRLTSLSIYNGTTSAIGKGAFEGCTNLKTVRFADVEEIEDNAFRGCSALTEVQDGYVSKIRDHAFADCENLTRFSCSVSEIGNYAFENCSSLIYVNTNSSTNAIMNGAFKNCKSLPILDIRGVNDIKEETFMGCENLASIFFPTSSNVTIRKNAFNGCIALNELILDTGNSISNKKIICEEGNESILKFIGKDEPDIPDEPEVVIGDIDGDGKITSKDANMLKKMVTGSENSTSSADMDADGKINAKDISILIRMIIGAV